MPSLGHRSLKAEPGWAIHGAGVCGGTKTREDRTRASPALAALMVDAMCCANFGWTQLRLLTSHFSSYGVALGYLENRFRLVATTQ